jgi:AmmeMemoRadiSam system protein A
VQDPEEIRAAQSDLLNRRAGVFVSIHKNGSLRGCIGTISPTCSSIAQEIAQNAVSASTKDPRFPAIRPSELYELEITVDVLGETERISSPDQLDVKRYGVIVSKGYRRGLLLPNLDGVDTVEEQIGIAMQKAGLDTDEENYELERFEVVRHY